MDYAESTDRQPPEPTFRKDRRAYRLHTDSGFDTATYPAKGLVDDRSLAQHQNTRAHLLQGQYSPAVANRVHVRLIPN